MSKKRLTGRIDSSGSMVLLDGGGFMYIVGSHHFARSITVRDDDGTAYYGRVIMSTKRVTLKPYNIQYN